MSPAGAPLSRRAAGRTRPLAYLMTDVIHFAWSLEPTGLRELMGLRLMEMTERDPSRMTEVLPRLAPARIARAAAGRERRW